MEFPEPLISTPRRAGSVTVLTGSGISAESGVPNFREAQTGLWSSYDPQELATPDAFQRDPRLVWEWDTWRRMLVEKARPNAGHLALASLQKRIETFTLITQNVDGLHQRAGSEDVLELHGNIRRSKCSEESIFVELPESGEAPPACPRCGAPLRPDVVWFGEALPHEHLERASAASRACELFLSVGTSSLVHPAASLPYEALSSGVQVVEVNPDRTPLTADATYSLRGRAGEILPDLLRVAFEPGDRSR
ncbi:MAG: SIR2 family NAD-dependent protein deacylase [Rubrobacteraceae bacterium]